jgi:PilZ domain
MEERRKIPRGRTLKSGKIVLKLHSSVVDCTIRNLTEHGALLLVPSLVGIPENFELMLEPSHIRHDCRVVWRGDNRLGVEFA